MRIKLLYPADAWIVLSILFASVTGCVGPLSSPGQTAQTITFATPAAQTVGTSLTLSATASSGLAVSFASSTTSVCTVSGTTATFLIAGTCSTTASQAGNSTFAAATPVTDSFTVNAAAETAQTITFAMPATQTVGTPLILSATASSGLPVSFASNTTSVCTVSGATATFLIAGSCSITASQAGNGTFAAATPVTVSFTVNAAALTAQTITFATPATQTVGVDLPLSATASSGLVVSFASTTTSVCTVSGATATFLIAGTCSITASQAGNSTYAAATPVTDSFMVNAATTGSGLPPLPAMSNVQAQVSGSTVNITFDPVDGAQDYRAYLMPENSDIVTSGGDLVGVKNAIYRCAGLRAVPPVQPAKDAIDATNTFGQGSGNDSFTQTHVGPYKIEFGPDYTRTTADDTLGYVFTSSQPNTAPVYEVGDPGAFSDHYGDGIRLKQTREKMYLQDFTTYQAKVAAGWRDDGIVFYAPTNASACGGSVLRPVDEIETIDTGYNLLYRWYYSSTAEVAAWSTVNFASTPQNTPFSVCSTQATGSQPLMRVNYTFPTNQNAHDELAVGQSRYDLARCQGTTTGSCANVASRALWSIRYSGITAPTQLIVEALDSGCPYPGGLWGTESESSSLDPIIPTPPYPTPVDNFTDPIFTLAQIQQTSPGGIGEAYLNGQFDLVPNALGEAAGSPFVTNGTPHPIARTVLNVAPQARPAMDFSSNFENSETFTEVFTNIDGSPAPDCGLIEAFPPNGDIQAVFPNFEAVGCQDSYQLTSPTYDVLVFGGESPETVGIAQGEFITAGGGAVWTAPLHPPAASISPTDNTKFLHAALEVNGYSDDRRYPQIMISDHWEGTPGNTTPPVQDVPPTFMTTQWYLLDAPANDPSGDPFPDGDEQNTLFLTAIYSTGPNMLIELCSNRGWAVNEHCPYFILERFGTSLVPNPFSSTPPEIHPETSNAFPDINDVMQEDAAVRWDLYVSKHKIYFYANSKAYGCVNTTTVAGIKSGDNTPHIPTGSVNVSFGDRLYHPEAETGELCATNSFLCRHSNFETSRRYDYFGYSSNQSVTVNSSGQFNAGSDGTTATWDESVIPCNSVIFDNDQNGGTLNPEQ